MIPRDGQAPRKVQTMTETEKLRGMIEQAVKNGRAKKDPMILFKTTLGVVALGLSLGLGWLLIDVREHLKSDGHGITVTAVESLKLWQRGQALRIDGHFEKIEKKLNVMDARHIEVVRELSGLSTEVRNLRVN